MGMKITQRHEEARFYERENRERTLVRRENGSEWIIIFDDEFFARKKNGSSRVEFYQRVRKELVEDILESLSDV